MLPEATEVYMLDNQSVMLSLKKLPIDKAITFCHMEQNLCMIQSTLSLKNDGLVYALILLTPTVFLARPEQPLGRGSALSRLGAELELRRSGSSLGPSQ